VHPANPSHASSERSYRSVSGAEKVSPTRADEVHCEGIRTPKPLHAKLNQGAPPVPLAEASRFTAPDNANKLLLSSGAAHEQEW